MLIIHLVLFADQMVINIDQTGVSVIPTSNWTMHEKGAKQVPIAAKEDKRQITALLACSLDGDLLPLQLVYGGKTAKCHPDVDFPKEWSVTHSDNHWSTTETMKQYITEVLVPYFANVRTQLNLDENKKALCILDVFRAHRVQEVMELFSQNNILLAFVPANCTGELQPLDLSGNGTFKDELRAQFTAWYADQVPDDDSSFSMDMKLSTLKPQHARWVINAWQALREHKECLIAGWQKSGIASALKDTPIDILIG